MDMMKNFHTYNDKMQNEIRHIIKSQTDYTHTRIMDYHKKLYNEDRVDDMYCFVKGCSDNPDIVNAMLNDRTDVIRYSIIKNHDQLFHLLIDNRFLETSCDCELELEPLLNIAVTSGNTHYIKKILKLDWTDINLSNPKNGNTALHKAVNFGKKHIVKLLLDNGASTNIQNLNGETPLHLAIKYLKHEITQMLLDNPKTCVTIKDNNGKTPLSIAVSYKDSSRLKMIIKAYKSRGINIKPDIITRYTKNNNLPDMTHLL